MVSKRTRVEMASFFHKHDHYVRLRDYSYQSIVTKRNHKSCYLQSLVVIHEAGHWKTIKETNGTTLYF